MDAFNNRLERASDGVTTHRSGGQLSFGAAVPLSICELIFLQTVNVKKD